jgi:hypothetical protein
VRDNKVAQLCAKISEECEAMKCSDVKHLSSSARHALLDARMQRIDTYHAQLVTCIGEQEANNILCELYMQIMG